MSFGLMARWLPRNTEITVSSSFWPRRRRARVPACRRAAARNSVWDFTTMRSADGVYFEDNCKGRVHLSASRLGAWRRPALSFQPRAMMVGFGNRVGFNGKPLRVGHHTIVRELHLNAVLVVEQQLRVN